MNDVLRYGLYFLIGGTVVSLSSYLGSRGEGFLAAFASTFPAITGVTFILIHLNGGQDHVLPYAKHLLWFVPPWLAYVGVMILGLNRLGFWPAMILSLAVYMGGVGLLRLALR